MVGVNGKKGNLAGCIYTTAPETSANNAICMGVTYTSGADISKDDGTFADKFTFVNDKAKITAYATKDDTTDISGTAMTKVAVKGKGT